MISFLLRRLAAFTVACGLATSAAATSFSTDFTDLWWSGQAESGWGVNVIQQGDTLFATFFIYGPDNAARWYVAPATGPGVTVGTSIAFTGKLYRTTGPFFGSTFDPNAVVSTEVGTATFTFPTSVSGTLTYSIDSVQVVKQIQRQTFRNNPPTGRYDPSSITAVASSCGTATNNGPAYFDGITIATISGTTLTMQINQTNGIVCTLTGPYVQNGRLGTVSNGTWTCLAGTVQRSTGTFSLSSLDTQVAGFNGTFQAVDNFCTYRGNIGGIRDVVGN